jgi:hypothetical protein
MAMKVRDLIERLQKLDPDMEVFNFNSGIDEDSYTPIESVEVGPPTMYPQHSTEKDAALLN